MNAQRLTRLALFTAMAIILHIAEGLIPVVTPVAGVRLGFANIISLAAIALLGWRDALLIVALRTTLASLLSGSFFGITFAMSFVGGFASVLVMGLLYRLTGRGERAGFSLIGVSIAGALTHNLCQLLVASLLIENTAIFYYLPLMLLSSLPTGILIGILSRLLIPRLSPLLNK